jgi:zinc D-Ala-D-Ala carboxypeptidase
VIKDWAKFPNFTKAEFTCSHTGQCDMDPTLLELLQALRREYGKPLVVTSGYRHPTHPIEAAKPEPGFHSKGMAVDIACEGGQAFKIVKLAFKHGFSGIGISQRNGLPRFVHLDIRPGTAVVYSY